MKRTIILFFMFLAAVVEAYSQNNNINISGTVKDKEGAAMTGAAVILEGTASVGAIVDDSGNYSLSIPVGTSEKAVLVVQNLGYKEVRTEINGRSRIDFILETDAENLEEIVVVGYGTMRKSDLTGSLTSVKIDENQAAQVASIDGLLQGRAAGVQVLSNSASPDAGVSIRVRGLGSFNGGNEPLYVVDGVIINASSGVPTLFTHGADSSGSDEEINGLMGINPQDIENIEILKDASATAIYGSQGANGVVLITTKSAKSDKPAVYFTAGIDVGTRYGKMDMLSFDEYMNYLSDLNSAAKDKLGDDSYSSLLRKVYTDTENKTGLKVKPIDWQDYAMRTAVSQRYYLSVYGKPKAMSYKFSFGYNTSQGIIKQSDVDRYTLSMDLNRDLSKKVKMGAKVRMSYVNSNLTQGTQVGRIAASASFMRSMLMTRPWTYLTEEDDTENADEYVSGPDKWLKDFVSRRNQFKVTPSLYLDAKITPWLSFKSTFGADYSDLELTKFKSVRVSTTTGSIAAVAHSENLMYNFDNMLIFNKQFGAHNLSGTLGMSVTDYYNTTQTVEGWDIEQYKAQELSINGAENANMTYSKSRNSLLSFFGRAIYNYRDRYILTATVRYDGSSRFMGRNKWSVFPSFAAAWRVNQEKWFNVDLISQLKVRLGWGQVGNQAISNYQTLSNYTNSKIGNHLTSAGYDVSIYPDKMPNPDLKWETSESWNAGVDFGMWGGRLSMTLDLYNRMTKDLLQLCQVARSTGFETMWVNQGAIRNYGLELTVDATPIAANGWEWNIGGNISFNRNRIHSMGKDSSRGKIYLSEGNLVETNYFLGQEMSSTANTTVNIFVEGQPMGLFYAYKTDGIVQEGETGPGFSEGETLGPGHYKYVDMDGNGYITDDDRTIIGDPNPDFTYGFNTSVSYRQFSLSMAFTGSYGNDVFNLNNNMEYNTSSAVYNVRRIAYEKAWTPENPDTTFPAVGMTEGGDNTKYRDVNVEDGSFLRLSSLSFNYSLKPKKNKILKRVVLGVSANNLFVLTKYSGWDPDINSFGSNIMRMGVDFNSYPTARTFSFDMKFTF